MTDRTDLKNLCDIDRTRLFDGGKNRFITCNADETLNAVIFHPFRLFSLPTLEAQFLEMLQADFATPVSLGEAAK